MDIKTLKQLRKKIIKFHSQVPGSFNVSRCVALVDNMIELEETKIRPCGQL